VSITPANNAEEGSPGNRYLVAPEDYFEAECDAARRDLAVTGFYHSHPDAEAVPSEDDRAGALPGVSYLILSVIRGRVAGIGSWTLDPVGRRFASERLRG
jgi:proteasome lid subunit RPN8/RPN11